jgi:NTP pyrophosphatase (non-canonical NTP hydrolase)
MENINPTTNNEELEMEVMEAIMENDADYNLLKLAEECTEVAELCIKLVTKDASHKPPIEQLCAEIGDLTIRIVPVIANIDPSGQIIEKAMEAKMAKLHTKINTYKGRL